MTRTILLVDDQREVIRLLRKGIESLDQPFEIHEALSGEEALLAARLKRADMVISDVHLPGISGLDMMKRLRVLNPDLKVILLTGVSDPELRVQVADAGALAFFLKPIELPDVLDAIERAFAEPDGGFKPREVERIPPVQGVSDRLAGLRREVSAMSAILLNDNGQLLVRAGDLPDAAIESSLVPSLMAAFSSGQKIGRFLGTPSPTTLHFFKGAKYDLVMASVGQSYVLLIVVNSLIAPDAFSRVATRVSQAALDMGSILMSMGVPVSAVQDRYPQVPPFLPVSDAISPAAAQPVDSALEQLLDRAETGIKDAETFWETSQEQSSAGNLDADSLSYDQAVQLGLAPGEE